MIEWLQKFCWNQIMSAHNRMEASVSRSAHIMYAEKMQWWVEKHAWLSRWKK